MLEQNEDFFEIIKALDDHGFIVYEVKDTEERGGITYPSEYISVKVRTKPPKRQVSAVT